MTAKRHFPFKRVCVFGAARSGVGAMHLLRHHNVEVVLVDERPAMEFRSLIRRLRRLYVTPFFGQLHPEESLRNCEAIVVSPGIPLEHPLIMAAMERDLAVISEVELASYFAEAPIIAITGTNGKTTSTILTGQMVADAGFNAVVSGNIGRAFSEGVLSTIDEKRDTVLVTEVSSFQLESIDEFCPHVAAILNITRDHMDRYASMGEYIEAKYRITHNQGPEDYLVLNADDPLAMKVAEESEAQIFTFSMTREVEQGAFVEGNTMYLKEDGERRALCSLDDIPLPGAHNLENVMAAAVMVRRIGLSDASIRRTLEKFQTGRVKAPEHRIEYVKTINNVRWYNDSKATNLDSLEKALLSFKEPIVLIAGGRDKNSKYERLNSLIGERLRALVVMGEAAPLITTAWGGIVETKVVANMHEAVRMVAALAQPGDVALLSPACSSFDLYKNFEERGKDFKREVRDMVL